jgi:hypothetical protein
MNPLRALKGRTESKTITAPTNMRDLPAKLPTGIPQDFLNATLQFFVRLFDTTTT